MVTLMLASSSDYLRDRAAPHPWTSALLSQAARVR